MTNEPNLRTVRALAIGGFDADVQAMAQKVVTRNSFTARDRALAELLAHLGIIPEEAAK